MLYAKILRSPHASAEIVSIDLSAAQSLPGVKAVLKLKEGRVKYEGEQIAAVAAVDEKTAEEALKLIKVEYKVLPHVVTPDKAMAEGAPQVQDSANVEKLNEYSRGNIDQGFTEAEVTFERTYRTAIEIHQPVETHASIAKWDEDELTVWDSTQAIFSVRDGLARALDIPATKVRVIKMYMGGGFGSKLSFNDHTSRRRQAGQGSRPPGQDHADAQGKLAVRRIPAVHPNHDQRRSQKGRHPDRPLHEELHLRRRGPGRQQLRALHRRL